MWRIFLHLICVPLWATVPPAAGVNCAQCHVGPVTNAGRVIVDFTKIGYVPRQTQTIGVHVLPTAGSAATSFQLTARLASGQQAGLFFQSADTIRIDTLNGIQYVSGTQGAAITRFLWTPPGSSAGAVRFEVTAVAGIAGNGTAEGNVYSAAYTVDPATRDLPDGYRFQTIALPSTDSYAYGLASNGAITGFTGNSGFIRSADGNVTTFQFPGASHTYPRTINAGGRIAGYYKVGDSLRRGFFREPNGSITSYQPSADVFFESLNDGGQTVGTLGNGAVSMPFNSPAGLSQVDGNAGTGISASGNIVGQFHNSAFLRTTDGVLRGITMCAEGIVYTIFRIKINDNNQVAGGCYGGGQSEFVMAENGRRWFPPTGYQVMDQTESGTLLLAGGVGTGAAAILTPCTGTASVTGLSIGAAGGTLSVPVQPSAGCSLLVTEDADWITAPSVAPAAFDVTIPANADSTARIAEIRVGASTVTINQTGTCTPALSWNSLGTPIPSTGITGRILSVATQPGCQWELRVSQPWIVLSATSGSGPGTVGFSVLPNNSRVIRAAVIDIPRAGGIVLLQDGATTCSYAVDPPSLSLAQSGGTGVIRVSAGEGCSLTANSASPNITLPYAYTGNGELSFIAGPNLAAAPITTHLTVAGITIPVTQAASTPPALRYVPVTPCRAVDTRLGAGGRFTAGETRSLALPDLNCGIPATARAVAMNLTAVPPAPLGFVTVFPTGQPRPFVSTLNSFNGRVVANFAIVPLSANGSVSVYTTDSTHILVDVMGYFIPRDTPQSLQFYPLAPCRVSDTRNDNAPLNGATSRSFGLRGTCGIPADAQAYSLNLTAVPLGALAYLTAWPSGQPQPLVSNLNAFDGSVVPNAAIIPAGANGNISLFASDRTHVVIDVNGYFAAPATGGLDFYPLTPCRVADTRAAQTTMARQSGERFTPSVCGTPSNAKAYSLNATAVPQGYLGYVTLYSLDAGLPLASTLNSWNGQIVANAAIVPASPNVFLGAYASNRTDLVLDINGYFAP